MVVGTEECDCATPSQNPPSVLIEIGGGGGGSGVVRGSYLAVLRFSRRVRETPGSGTFITNEKDKQNMSPYSLL